MLLELFVVFLEVIVNPARLFLLNEALLDHVLSPCSVRCVHGDERFPRGLINILDEMSLEQLK